MWNEHSVCEREYEAMKDEAKYWKELFHNEYEARQRLIEGTKRYVRALEEIRDYEAYSWSNDRQFIDTRINEAFGTKTK